MMKILLATSKAIPGGGGIASYNQELVRLLGKDNSIYLLTDSDEKNVDGYISTFSTYGQINSNYDYCKSLIEHINNFEYDCIINSNSAFIPVIAPFLKSPIISVSHFVNGSLAINAGYNAKYLNAIIALSNYGKIFIERQFDIESARKVSVIYNFVKVSNKYYDEGKSLRKPLTIVYPGGTSVQKSVDVIQQLVYKLLRSKYDFRFIWLGGTRLPSAKMSVLGLKTTESLFPNDNRLIITGNVNREKAMDIIGSANIFLLPSRGEGCPMTLLEAMRGGCIPVISDAHHGSREILELSETGIITKQGSASALFKGISDIIVNHEQYMSDYKRTKEYLKKELSEDKWSEKMNQVIKEAVNKSKLVQTLSRRAFKSSYQGYSRLMRWERIKTVCRSGYYRLKLDILFLRNKINMV